MILRQALRIDESICIAIVGAGGKTTLMFRLGRQFPSPVIVTTTTHLGIEQIKLADQHFYIDSPDDLAFIECNMPSGITLVTGPKVEDRVSGLNQESLLALQEAARKKRLPLLIEADGSRCLPLKAPAKFEPAIPPRVDMVVNVVGLSGLGKPFSAETVHRHEEFASLSGLSMLNPITPEALTKVLSHGEGGLKNIPSRARKVIVLNQADTQEINVIEGMAAQLKEVYDAVLICALNSTNSQEEVLSVHELIGGIILAAGSSTRMGIPKILLEWKEQTLIRTIAEKALQGGLLPVIVVAGELIVQVVRSLEGLPVKLIENKQWHEGQSVSIVKGLQAVGRRVGGAIFLLADQPQIPVALIEELVKQHSFSLSPIIAPRVAGKRANPVLFDAVTFPALLKLIGDSGGRQIFDQFPPDWLEWSDDTILLDVDTPADYQQLKNLGSP